MNSQRIRDLRRLVLDERLILHKRDDPKDTRSDPNFEKRNVVRIYVGEARL